MPNGLSSPSRTRSYPPSTETVSSISWRADVKRHPAQDNTSGALPVRSFFTIHQGRAERAVRLAARLSWAAAEGARAFGVRVEDRFDADIETVWSALTDPSRLASWWGEVEGDLRLGGEYRARVFASGWEGTGRVEACEAPRWLLVLTREPDQSEDQSIEVTLTADGGQTTVVWEERGMPVAYLAGYGAGIQVHVEDLGAYLAGRGRCDAGVRMGELFPAYEPLAAKVS